MMPATSPGKARMHAAAHRPQGLSPVPRAESPLLCIVVPCKDEAEALPDTHAVLMRVLGSMIAEGIVTTGSYILYVDDGSDDGTWDVISSLAAQDPCHAGGIALSANRGHQNALLAGIEAVVSGCDAIVTIDADLQDDPEVMPEMVRAYMDGYDIVYGVRSDRSSDRIGKRWTAHLHYSLMRALGARTVYDHSDYRLMSRRAAEALGQYTERNMYLRGIVAQLGFRTASVAYARRPRLKGHTKYPLSRMVNLSIDGITSFSVRPVRMVFVTGLVFMVVALAMLAYVLTRYFSGHTMEGWTSLILSVWFCSGILLMGLGVIGEYVGKIYTEVKHRPRSHRERAAGRAAQQTK